MHVNNKIRLLKVVGMIEACMLLKVKWDFEAWENVTCIKKKLYKLQLNEVFKFHKHTLYKQSHGLLKNPMVC